MDLDTIRKFLSETNPDAHLKSIKKNVGLYYSNISIDNSKYIAYFQIPLEEIMDLEFKIDMQSKELLNWLTNFK